MLGRISLTVPKEASPERESLWGSVWKSRTEAGEAVGSPCSFLLISRPNSSFCSTSLEEAQDPSSSWHIWLCICPLNPPQPLSVCCDTHPSPLPRHRLTTYTHLHIHTNSHPWANTFLHRSTHLHTYASTPSYAHA